MGINIYILTSSTEEELRYDCNYKFAKKEIALLRQHRLKRPKYPSAKRPQNAKNDNSS